MLLYDYPLCSCSGRAPSKLTLDLLSQQGYTTHKPFPAQAHGHAVTVPGAPAAWVDTVEKFGSGKVGFHVSDSEPSQCIIHVKSTY